MQDNPGNASGVQHLAVVMDGNGRWARERGRPRSFGHRAGVRAARQLVEDCVREQIPVLTLFAFSSENWKRPGSEVRLLMGLFVEALQREVRDLHENGVRLQFIGDRSVLDARLQQQMREGEELTCGNTRLRLMVAISFGGRWDLVEAARALSRQVAAGTLQPDAIDEGVLGNELALGGLPDPDLFVRTGGESRLSNFLLWNLAYSELYFTELLWPDFSAAELSEALEFYAARQRRFGRTGEQVKQH